MKNKQNVIVIINFITLYLLSFLPELCYAQKYYSGHFEYTHYYNFTYRLDLLLCVHADSLMPDTVSINPGHGDMKKIPLADTKTTGNNSLLYRYSTFHTFSSWGIYTLQYMDSSSHRYGINMPNPVPFFIEGEVGISPFFTNNSAVLNDKPLVIVRKNNPFTYNACAVDYTELNYITGNDLLFEWLITNNSYFIPQGMSLNEKSGEITWENPDSIGLYNFSIKITERKQNVTVGYIVKNIVFCVVDSLLTEPVFNYMQNWQKNSNGYYEYRLKPDENLQLFFSYSDTQADSIFIDSYSETYGINNPATFTNIVSNNIHYGMFDWTPDYAHIRAHPYLLYFIAGSMLPDSTLYHHYITVMIYVEAPLNAETNNYDVKPSLHIYPNPSVGLLNIQIKENTEGYINLLNSLGSLIKQWKINPDEQLMQIDIESFAPGLYFLQVQTPTQVQTAKIIKQ